MSWMTSKMPVLVLSSSVGETRQQSFSGQRGPFKLRRVPCYAVSTENFLHEHFSASNTRMHLLHGDLEVEVVGASNLHDTDNLLWNIVGGDKADCWVEVYLAGRRILATSVHDNVIKTTWGERVALPVCDVATHLDVAVWDEDIIRPELVGRGKLPLGAADKAWAKDDQVFLEGGKGRVHLKVRFTPAALAAQEGIEVPRTYFPARKGGSLTLYQDAHTSPASLAGTEGAEGAFEAIANSLRRAKRFIYIAGWSVRTRTRLERDGQEAETLGELLKAKAAEGVRVLILLWDEKFSSHLCAGLVGTHDSETGRYFEGTGVHVAQVHRRKKTLPLLRGRLAQAVWTHHQKAVIADDDEASYGLVAFVGGLDLTDGRWDTPDHELFATLKEEHRDDFHNGFIEVSADEGPREPWHDVHSRLSGPCALDVLKNFEERWRRQAPDEGHLLLSTPRPDAVLDGEVGGATWQMQVVRSIDANSAAFSGGRANFLNSYDGRTVDTSLQRAFVRLIRRAEDFLYIESQYFIGSSQNWEEDTDANAFNLVPLEIAQRVANRIREGKALRVYLVLPLLPEGNPANKIHKSSMNAIMRWQFLTLQMMYKKIAEALKEVGSTDHPTDFLLPLCLAKQESGDTASRGLASEEGSGAEWLWRQRRKFLIYVHSKMAIADDAHVIVGSANLNERSLEGTRDSEIAVSACQTRPDGSGGETIVKDGDVSAFRRALWSEHTWGISEEEGEVLGRPGSLGAVRRIRDLAEGALKSFAKGVAEEHRSRFMSYPLSVSTDGAIGPLPDMPTIPGFDLSVTGACTYIPPIVTT